MVLYKLLMCLYIDITLCYLLTHFMPLISFYTPWNIRNQKNKSTRPLVFWWFQGVQKETSGMTWVNEQMVPFVPVSLMLSFHKFLKFLFICHCCMLHFFIHCSAKGCNTDQCQKIQSNTKAKTWDSNEMEFSQFNLYPRDLDWMALISFDSRGGLQSFPKYLRQTLVFMWNSALRERFYFFFQEISSRADIFISGERLSTGQ